MILFQPVDNMLQLPDYYAGQAGHSTRSRQGGRIWSTEYKYEHGAKMSNRQDIRAWMSESGLAFSRARGQNFLADSEVLSRIGRCLPDDQNAMTVEIGTGPATLTRTLFRRFGRLITFEIDSGIIRALNKLELEDAELRHVNFLQVDTTELRNEMRRSGLERLYLIGNLPYSSGTRMLVNALLCQQFDLMVFMLQKEVVARALAPCGSSGYGVLSVLCALFSQAEKCFDVAPSCFVPKPTVWSSVLKLQLPAQENHISGDCLRQDAEITLALLKTAFSQRRKMIANSLSSVYGSSRARAALERCDIDPRCRPERIAPHLFLNLARELKA